MHDPFDGISHPPKRAQQARVDTVALKQRIDRDDRLIRANSARKTTAEGKTTLHTPTSLAATARKAARQDTLATARKRGG
jgi:hypothetical protein